MGGGVLSIFIFAIVLLFATVKLKTLLLRSNPTLSVVTLEDEFDEKDKYETQEEGFMMGFRLERSTSGSLRSNPRYLKWIARYREIVDGVKKHERLIALHPCTEEDYAKFHQPAKRAAAHVEKMKKSRRGLMCLDW
eukprot:CAMPEP_0170470690 /NCGR_PEP_ID=MMETSP0123-20130129/13082_1 /TAXON_ID=182087 /ORGANISM="Favella ehrenbergii, Strain Fehren 1" /LENGTH=135 /DNA_ID=CAMNT_0010737935 /DNA_START=54 /DNA_END=458 /DNA_ORIENTATION=+